MKIGTLIILAQPVYLYQDAPIFPWNKLPVGTKLIVLSVIDPLTEYVKVLVDDGREGFIHGHQLEGCGEVTCS